MSAAGAGVPSRLAIVPVRAGAPCVGGVEAVAEAAGWAVLVGDGTDVAAKALAGVATAEVAVLEEGDGFAPARWSAALASTVEGSDIVILPSSPDGRDLAPRLAAVLDRPLVTGALQVFDDHVSVARWGGQVVVDVAVAGPVVVTLEPGVRGAPEPSGPAPAVRAVAPDGRGRKGPDVEVLDVLPPDVATMDLAEAPRIVGGGAGLGGAEEFAALAEVGAALGASLGATRVVTDAGLVSHERQIGTTGVVVGPRLYLAFGISGAVQHTAGLGAPEHVVSVNLDPHCPMMAMADLAVVADAPAVVRALARRLAGPPEGGDPRPGQDGGDG